MESVSTGDRREHCSLGQKQSSTVGTSTRMLTWSPSPLTSPTTTSSPGLTGSSTLESGWEPRTWMLREPGRGPTAAGGTTLGGMLGSRIMEAWRLWWKKWEVEWWELELLEQQLEQWEEQLEQ